MADFLPNLTAIVANGRAVGLKEAAIANAGRAYINLSPGGRRLEVGSFGHIVIEGVRLQVAYEPAGDSEEFSAW